MTETYTNPNQSLGFLLHQAAINWRRALASELRHSDITPVQFFMLGSTSRLTRSLGQPPMQKDIVENTGIDINVVSQVVRHLEKQGLMKRIRDQKDARVIRLSLTTTGHAKLQDAISSVHAVDAVFFANTNHSKLDQELQKLLHP